MTKPRKRDKSGKFSNRHGAAATRRTDGQAKGSSRLGGAGRVFAVAKDRYLYLALILVSVLTRLPILRSFDLVTFDGTSYVKQAKAILAGTPGGGAFPIGYPLATAIFIPVIGDGVRAAQLVSFLASIGAAIVIYRLARRFVPKDKAFFCALVVSVNPLFIRLSLMTFSESLYIFWVCLALLFYAANRDVGFGATMGLASITRPEAIAIFGVLMLLRIRSPKRLWVPATLFLVLFAANSAYLSVATGRTVILPKSEFLGTSAERWQLRETSVDFEGKDEAFEAIRDKSEPESANYLRRLPEELLSLHRYVLPVLLLLAILGMVKRPGFVGAALVPFFFVPAFTVRSEARYLLPYVPILILYGFIGVECIRRRMARRIAYILITIGVVVSFIINYREMAAPVNPEYIASKRAGLRFRDMVAPTDKIADRKPFFAFYAGGRYIEIPIAPYEDVMEFLVDEDVKLLSLHKVTTHYYRPALRPLIYDRPAINGELRLTQVYYDEGGVLIYARTDSDETLTWRSLTDLDATTEAPSWSPDGGRIAFRLTKASGESFIYVADADGGQVRSIVPVASSDDPLTWSPDGKRIAYAEAVAGNWDVYIVDVENAKKTRLTSDPSIDSSPAWSSDGEIAFRSNRTGRDEIWLTRPGAKRTTQLTTDGSNTYPIFSHGGNQIAWLHGTNAVVLDRATNERRTAARGNIAYRVSWSPDDRFLATESDAWGSVGIYIVAADASNALLVTKTADATRMPSWDPRGGEIAVASKRDGKLGVWVLDGVSAYVARLENPPQIRTFAPPPEP